MGGKRNQAQRTKNNVRPSSSGRSAELLGSGVTNFVGFSTVKEAGYVPVLSGFAEEVYLNISTNFQLVLKKMNKKDSITKLKALNEFGALCRESDAATVKTILNYWPRMYCLLATDVEHRVREAAHNAHRAVVASVGRSIAPHLKQLVGAWFCSQFDTYPPAASAASLSFKEAFPPNKMIEAINFCKEEIINYIHDNLMNQTPQSLSNPKTTTQDEMEGKYQRVVTSCLSGYALFLNQLPKERILEVEELNKKLVGSAKFWKFSKNAVPSIRSAWYSALVSLCQNAPFLLKDEKKHVTLAVFSNLDEADPTVLPVVWEASLHTIVMIEDWSQYVSAEKLVFPKLWRILKEGGLGSAHTIYPNILPLLSNLPPSLVPDKQIFYSKLFSNMIEGTKHKSVYQSQMESETVAQCFMECLSYTIMKNIDDSELCSNLVTTQLMAMLEVALSDSKLKLLRRFLACDIANHINQWSSQKPEGYKALTESFWTHTYSLCQKLIDSNLLDRKILTEIINAQSELFTFLGKLKYKQKKHAKVTFCEEEESPEIVDKRLDESSNLNIKYKSDLLNFICKILSLYFIYISGNEPNRSSFFKQVSKIVSAYESEELYSFVTSLSGENKTWDQFYNESIIYWLKNDNVDMEDVLNLTFSFLKYVHKEGEKKNVLDALTEIDSKCVLEWCLKKENINHKSVKEWLRYDQTNEILQSLLENLISSGLKSGKDFDILKQCLVRTEQSDFVIELSSVTSILTRLVHLVESCSSIVNPNINIDGIAELLMVGVEAIVKCYKFPLCVEETIKIVSVCFDFCLHQNCTVLEEVWISIIVNLVSSLNAGETETILNISDKFSDMVALSIASRDNLTQENIQIMVDQSAKYLQCLYKCKFENVSEIALIFIDKVQTQSMNRWDESILHLCYQAEIISGRLELAALDNDLCSVNSSAIHCCSQSVSKCVTSTVFQVHLLFEILGVDVKEDSDLSLNNININVFSTSMANLVFKSTVFQIFKENFSKTENYFKVADLLLGINPKIKELVQRLDTIGLKEIEKEIIHRGDSSLCPGLWAKALSVLHSDFLDIEDLAAAFQTLLEENKLIKLSPLCSVWLPQVFANGAILEDDKLKCDRPEQELNLLSCHLRNCKSENKAQLIEQHCRPWLEKIIKLGKMSTYETNLSKCSESDLRFASSIAEFLSLMVQHCPEEFDQKGWDCPMIATASWILSVNLTVASGNSMYESLIILHFSCAVCRLFKVMSKHMSSPDLKSEETTTEWKDVFLADTQKFSTELWLEIADHYLENPSIKPGLVLILLNELSEIVGKLVEIELFIGSNTSSLSDWLDTCCRLMKSHIADIQITAYNLFLKLVPQLVSRDAAYEEGTANHVSCTRFCDDLKYTQTILDTMLSELQLGDTCIVEPFTDSYTYTLSYLFLWLSILELCDKANTQLRFIYTGWIKENQFIKTLMKTLFCLMPEEAIHTHDGKKYNMDVKHIQELFAAPPDVSKVLWDSKMLAHLSCFTYGRLLARMPAEVRQWWSELDHKLATLVEQLTTSFVSPLLCANEMKAIQNDKKNFQNMTVQVRPVAREVAAVYTVEESRTELVIQLPVNHPLRPPKVESGKCMVSSGQTRQWLMKLSLFLTHQNGSIWDGLVIWKNDLDKKFEGVEECYICFAILSINQQLPKLVCQTCKKRFHSVCLYQWFTTSNKSSCPICRNIF